MATKKKVTDLTTAPSLHDADIVHVVLPSDTTHSLAGSSFKTTLASIRAFFGIGSNLPGDLNAKINVSEKGAQNGVATLDSGGKVPASQLPSTVMEFRGIHDVSTNSPALSDGTGDPGDVYLVSVGGTRDYGSGAITLSAGDWLVYSGSVWQKSINSNAVVSVNGMQGVITINKTHVGLGNVDNTSDANKPVSTAQQTALDLKADQGDLDAYIASNDAEVATKADASALSAHASDSNNPHGVTKSQVGLGNVNNTADSDKPVSTAQADAIANAVAPKADFSTAVALSIAL